MSNYTRYILLFFLILITGQLYAQKYTVSGFVRDKQTGEEMISANVFLKEIAKGGITNTYGFYTITVEPGEYTLVISYLGYNDFNQKINLTKDIRLNIELTSAEFVTEEVVIEAERSDKNIKSSIGAVQMPVKEIKKIPAFLGETDVLKTIQLLPGVQSAAEGASGFYVRGGGPDQNLVLLDEAVVYNASHLFGFFSVFNSDIVKDINLIKGGMPANYGGRISSVLDVTMKEGNNQNFDPSASIGLISSHLTLQGPIIKDKSSYIVTARRTYADLIISPFLPLFEKSQDYAGTRYYFHDINAKINYRFSDKDRLYLSGYYGKDVFLFDDKDSDFLTSIPWGNGLATLRWNHLFSDKIFMNTTATVSNYEFEMKMEEDSYEIILHSSILDFSAKMDFTYIPNVRHKLKFGINYIYHIFKPNSLSGSIGETRYSSKGVLEQYAHEAAMYLNESFDLTEKLNINVGLRAPFFQQIGPFERYIKDANYKTIDTIRYGRNDAVATYNYLEPRFLARYAFNNKSAAKASFTINYQFIHLASLSAGTLPTDLWIPSSELVKPQKGMQVSGGYFRNFKKDKYEASIELYYKKVKNLLEYLPGYTPEDNLGDNSDSYFTYGDGYSYGIEFFLKKRKGKLTGWIGYTISKTGRIFEGLNFGEEYPAKYDRRHDLSVLLSYKFNKKLTASAVFVYATGNSITLPVARFWIDGRIVSEYGELNAHRMPAYHRLDLSVSYNNEEKHKEKKIKKSWNFSIYNVYNRRNPYFIYFDNEGDLQSGNMQTVAKQVSLFPILPSITLNISF